MKSYPTETVKAKLLRDPEDPMHFFRKAIAESLPSPEMASVAFAVLARTLLLDRESYPAPLYAVISARLPAIAREVLPEGEGEEIARHLETT